LERDKVKWAGLFGIDVAFRCYVARNVATMAETNLINKQRRS
jgi:hypothetical protein